MRLHPFTPEPGDLCELPFGGRYVCVRVTDNRQHNAMLKNILSGWTIEAHHIYKREDGRVEWDYSSGGHFEEVEKNG